MTYKLPSFRGCRLCRNRLRIHLHAWPNLLRTLDHHAFASLQSVRNNPLGADTVANFDGNGWDNLRFDSSAFSALGGPGHFASGDARFYAAAGASGGHDADDRIVYDTSAGHLYYDADGSGAGAAQLIGNLPTGSTVVAT